MRPWNPNMKSTGRPGDWTPAPTTDRPGRWALCFSQLRHRGRLNWDLICIKFWSGNNYFYGAAILIVKSHPWSRSERHTELTQNCRPFILISRYHTSSWEKSLRFTLKLLVEHKHSQAKWSRLQMLTSRITTLRGLCFSGHCYRSKVTRRLFSNIDSGAIVCINWD